MLKFSDSTALIESAEARHNLSLELGPRTGLADLSKLSFSPFFGVSVGKSTVLSDVVDINESVEYIKDCLAFGLEFSRDEKILAVINDQLHAKNLQYTDGCTPAIAAKLASVMGARVEHILSSAIMDLPPHLQDRVIIAGWQQLVEMKSDYASRVEQARETYASDEGFEQRVNRIIEEMTAGRGRSLDDAFKAQLADHLLQEYALLAGGVEYYNEQGRTLFDLLVHTSAAHQPEPAKPARPPINTPDWKVLAQDLDTTWASASITLSRPSLHLLESRSEGDELAGIHH